MKCVTGRDTEGVDDRKGHFSLICISDGGYVRRGGLVALWDIYGAVIGLQVSDILFFSAKGLMIENDLVGEMLLH
jgi:hypothetical protein